MAAPHPRMNKWVNISSALPADQKYLISQDRSVEGHKRFMACDSMDTMLTRLSDINNGYEIVRSLDETVWLHIDCDRPGTEYSNERMKAVLSDVVRKALVREGAWPDDGTLPETHFLTASTAVKTSLHMKVAVRFGDGHALRSFMLRARDWALNSDIPELVYLGKKGVQCVIDVSIHSNLRSMRVFGKAKYGKENYLLEAPDDDLDDLIKLRRNLVRGYDEDPTPEVEIAPLGAPVLAHKRATRGPVRKMSTSLPGVDDRGDDNGKDKFGEYINKFSCLVDAIGGPVVISRVTEFGGGITCCSVRKDIKHVCPYAKRCHEGNNLYMIVNMQRKTITVRCHDEECKNRQDIQVTAYELDETDSHDRSHHASMHGQQHSIQWDEQYDEPEMRDYPLEPLVAVRAGMGTGKTKALLRLAAAQFTGLTKALIVTHSRALATKMSADFRTHGFVHYADRVGPIIDAKVVVCLDSVHRVATGAFDFVFLDEAVSLFLHLNSPLMGVKTSLNLSVLELAIVQAKHTYFLDACMDHTFGKSLVDYFGDMKGRDAYWVHNSFVRETNRKMFVDVVAPGDSNAMSKVTQLDRAGGKVLDLLRKGQNVVVCSSSKSFTVRLQNFIKAARPETTMLVYNSSTNESLEDVETDWAKCQLLIYSPTVTAGVSFEAEHFDSLVAMVSNSVHAPTVDMTLQQLFRVRRLSTGEMHVFVHEFKAAGKAVDEDRGAGNDEGDAPVQEGGCEEDDATTTYAMTREDIEEFLQSDVTLSDKYFSMYRINIPGVYRPSAGATLEYDTERLSFVVIVGIIMMRNRSTVLYSSILCDTVREDYGIPVVEAICPDTTLSPCERDLLKSASATYDAEPAAAVLQALKLLRDPLHETECELTAKTMIAAKMLREYMDERWRVDPDLSDDKIAKFYKTITKNGARDAFHRATRFVAMCDHTVEENRTAFVMDINDAFCKGDPNFELFKARTYVFKMKTALGQQFLEMAAGEQTADIKSMVPKLDIHEDRFMDAYDSMMVSLTPPEVKQFSRMFGISKAKGGFTVAKKILGEAFGIAVKRRDPKPDRRHFSTLWLSAPDIQEMAAEFGADLRRQRLLPACMIRGPGHSGPSARRTRSAEAATAAASIPGTDDRTSTRTDTSQPTATYHDSMSTSPRIEIAL